MHAARLLTLAAHLETGKLGVDEFDFGTYYDVDVDSSGTDCGTAGCAIGECPTAFPNDWYYHRYSTKEKFPRLNSQPHLETRHAGMVYFDLTYEEYNELFIPGQQRPKLGSDATKEQVAANIRAFVADKLGEGVTHG